MVEKSLSPSDDPSREHATDSTPHQYDIEAYIRARRTCEGVVRALGRAMQTDPHELPPLYTVVECDALEQLFCPRHDSRPQPDISITFTYDRYTVALNADGHLTIDRL